MIGTALGPYRLLSELGSGGMGKVYRAETTRRSAGLEPGTAVAVKVVHPHLLEAEGAFKRFLREAEIGRSVRHENVVRTFDADAVVVGGVPHHFLVMEYVEGQTLRSLLAELGRVPEDLCRHVGRETAQGLAAVHAAGVIHRDVKPENVLITKAHVVKVMDLGIARAGDEALRLSRTGAFVGSLPYAAPECFTDDGEGVDARTDLYALGVVLYELACAVHPFAADDVSRTLRRILDDTPRRCAELNPQLSPFFEEVVHRLLSKTRDERFASAAELAQVLDAGEASPWWKARAKALRATTKRPLRRIRIPRETALYGREAELGALRGLFEQAKAGEGQAVLILGEAGIGKSRLVDEVVGLLQREGEDLHFLYGGYPPGGAATASGAFSTAYREQFGEAGLEDTLRTYLLATPMLVPAFAALLRGEGTPTGGEPLTKDSLQTCFLHATRGLAAERTTVVLVDDLHFAPDEGRALFAALATAVAGHRILLVGTARPGMDGAWLSGLERAGVARLPLARLGPKDLGRLLVDALGSERTANELALQISTKSDGNPFFVFEILRGLREGLFLRRNDDGTWVTTRVIEDIGIPSTILELVQARVGGLAEDERNLLDVASCCGFSFDARLVAQALGMGMIPALQRFARVEQVHRLVRSVGPRFVFDHHQVQESLYAGLPEPLREEYHGAIAATLEASVGAAARDPGDLDGATCVDLAEHAFRGRRGKEGLRYLGAALSHLEKTASIEAAISLVGRALALPGVLEGQSRAELLVRQAELLGLVGRRAAQRAVIDEARSLADAAGDPTLRARVRISLGTHLFHVSRLAESEAAHREGLAIARSAGGGREEISALLGLVAAVQSRGRYPEALEHCEASLTLSRRRGDRRLEAMGVGNLAIVLSALGRNAEAAVHCERHLAIAHEIGNRREEARAALNLGFVLESLGRYPEALDRTGHALELARALGARSLEATATGNLGILKSAMGSPDEAREFHDRHLALSREIGDLQGESRATANLGSLLLQQGHLAEARASNARWLDLSRRIGDRPGEATALVDRGSLLHACGDHTAGDAALAQALLLSREIGYRPSEGGALHAIGSAAADRGDVRAARAAHEEALAIRRESGAASGIVDNLMALGALAREAGDGPRAKALLDEALQHARALQEPRLLVLAAVEQALLPGAEPREAVALLEAHETQLAASEAMSTHLGLWKVTHDGHHLRKAKDLQGHLLAHAPPECRKAMLEGVAIHREVAAAVPAHDEQDP